MSLWASPMETEATYAVVNKRKKRGVLKGEGHCTTLPAVKESECPSHPSMVGVWERGNTTPEVFVGDKPAENSVLEEKGLYSTLQLHTPDHSPEGAKKVVKRGKRDGSRMWCVVGVAVGIAAVVAVTCFIVLFIEVTKLQSTITSYQCLLPNDPLMVQLNQSLSNFEEKTAMIYTTLTHELERISEEQVQLKASDEQILLTLQNITLEVNQSVTEFQQQLNSNFTVLREDIMRFNQSLFSSAASCAALPASSPSGYYWVTASSGFAVRVYCDMARSCGNVT